MKNLGVLYVAEAGTGPWEDPNWTMFGSSNKEERVGLLLPTLQVPALVSSLLAACQQAAAGIPAAEKTEAAARYAMGDLASPIDVDGVELQDDGETLLVKIGFAVLRFKLSPESLREILALGTGLGG